MGKYDNPESQRLIDKLLTENPGIKIAVDIAEKQVTDLREKLAAADREKHAALEELRQINKKVETTSRAVDDLDFELSSLLCGVCHSI